MRPAHSAREIRLNRNPNTRVRKRFNEARAFSAGNPATSGATASMAHCFNEARAFSAGNLGGRRTRRDRGLRLQ